MRTLSIGNRGRASGFTLLEILVVLVIIAIGTALATPILTGLGAKRQLDAELRSLVLAVKMARSGAITRGCAFTLFLDPKEGTYWIESERDPGTALTDHRLPEGMRFKSMEVLQEQWRPQQAEGKEKEEKSDLWEIGFRSDGTGGDVAITLVDKEGEEHGVRIFGLLGRAEIEEDL